MEWLRALALATRPGDLVQTLESLAGRLVRGEAAYWSYLVGSWRLARNTEQRGLSEDSLESRCLVSGSPQTAQNVSFGGSSQAWPHVQAVPVRRFGSLLGVLMVGGEESCDPGPLQELAEVFALLHEPLTELSHSRQALSRFHELSVASVESLKEGMTGHVAAVCQLTAELAEFMDLSPQARRRLWNAALHHDVGMALLRQLGSGEMERLHPRVGADFLESTELYRDLAPLVLTHHERFDGTGYPNASSGDQLSIEQWVLVLAEDLAEFNELNGHLGYDTRIGIFFQEKARGHHPLVLDALAGLVDSGRLDLSRSGQFPSKA